MKTLTLGSLFDGIGGFPLAAQRCGIKTVWASEIEPACIEITKRHFPQMEHLGDITQINGGKITPVDIISFGSPCQDLSTAGKQKGLSGERSGLFLDAVRIIYEMRRATNGRYPTFIIWENVSGAFSSNGGNDFRIVLEKITNANIPMPKSGKWATAGMVRGCRGGQAWLGGFSIHSIGERPNVENGSSLWEILEPNAPPKYSLSAKACLGILKRAEKRL